MIPFDRSRYLQRIKKLSCAYLTLVISKHCLAPQGIVVSSCFPRMLETTLRTYSIGSYGMEPSVSLQAELLRMPYIPTSIKVFGLMGAARGLDQGLTGTTASLPSFSHLFDLKDPSKTPE